MPVFEYVALDRSGRSVRAVLEAASEEAAKASLRATGLTIVELGPRSLLRRDVELPFLSRPGARDLAVFCRQFAAILRAGVSVSQVLGLLELQTQHSKLREAVRSLRSGVEKGDALAGAMSRHPTVFPVLLVNMVAAGEESGNLEHAFRQMELYFDRVRRTRSKVGKAMLYPCVLLAVMVVVLIVLMVKIIPMFMKTFAQMNAQLPGPTRVVMAVSDWMVRWWWLLALALAGSLAGGLLFRKTERGRRVFGWLALHLPLAGRLTKRSECATLCRSLAVLLGAGLTLSQALELAAGNMTNVYYEAAIRKLRLQMAEGVSLTAGMQQEPLFPPMVCSLVGVGEETGTLAEMMAKAADYYDEAVSETTDKLMSLLEPGIILLMAIFVVFIVLAVFLPVLSMTQAYDPYL